MMSQAVAYRDEFGFWGVNCDGSEVYRPEFARATAEALALFEALPNQPDWEQAEIRLRMMGLPLPPEGGGRFSSGDDAMDAGETEDVAPMEEGR